MIIISGPNGGGIGNIVAQQGAEDFFQKKMEKTSVFYRPDSKPEALVLEDMAFEKSLTPGLNVQAKKHFIGGVRIHRLTGVTEFKKEIKATTLIDSNPAISIGSFLRQARKAKIDKNGRFPLRTTR